MALNTIGKIKTDEQSQTEEKQELQKENNANMVTIDRTKAEQFLIAIEECVGDIEEQKSLVDNLIKSKNEELQGFQSETIEKFNAIIQAMTDLAEKIKATESYENFLQEKVENANLSKSVAMLEQQLQKEKAEITSFIIKTDNFITVKIGEIQTIVNDLKTVDEMVEHSIQKFKDELQTEAKKYFADADKIMNETSDSFVNGAQTQYNSLKAECNAMIKCTCNSSNSNAMIKSYTEKCQQHLETLKKQSVDFLKQCEAENKKLIEKVPAVANKKFSIKDAIIVVLAVAAIASTFIQMLL